MRLGRLLRWHTLCVHERLRERKRERWRRKEGREGGMRLFSVSVDKISLSLFSNLFSLLGNTLSMLLSMMMW